MQLESAKGARENDAFADFGTPNARSMKRPLQEPVSGDRDHEAGILIRGRIGIHFWKPNPLQRSNCVRHHLRPVIKMHHDGRYRGRGDRVHFAGELFKPVGDGRIMSDQQHSLDFLRRFGDHA